MGSVRLASIGDFLNARDNNFDSIRFFAASLVIFGHAYAIAQFEHDPFRRLTHNQQHLGGLAVAIFFVISGFLITRSYERSNHLGVFLKARILRIIPGLAFMLFLSVFLLGPLVTTLSLQEYFSNPMTYDYLRNVFLHPTRYFLPGVFEANIYKGAVNGSLWTLEYEFVCYFIVGLLGLTRQLKKVVVLPLFIAIYFLSFLTFESQATTLYILLFKYFFAGAVIYLYRDWIPMSDWIALLSFAMLAIGAVAGGFDHFFVLFGSYLTIYLAFNRKIPLSNFSKYGDFSYGLYIYAFPLQQLVVYYFGGKMDPIQNFAISFPAILALSILSWHLVEKNFLKLRKVPLLPKSVQRLLTID